MAAPKGHKRYGGRTKGTPSKTSKIVDDVLLAFNKLGRDKWLVKQAEKNPQYFFTLLGKVIPTRVEGSGEDNEIVIKIIKITDGS